MWLWDGPCVRDHGCDCGVCEGPWTMGVAVGCVMDHWCGWVGCVMDHGCGCGVCDGPWVWLGCVMDHRCGCGMWDGCGYHGCVWDV